MTITRTLDLLLGHWSIDRSIGDHRTRTFVRFDGLAEVIEHGPTAFYIETGTVSTSGHTGPARRNLRLVPLPDGGVRFDFSDGRPFIEVDLTAGRACALHPCRDDTYQMEFQMVGDGEIHERWRVTGPEKDYSAHTVWRRR